ncbi:MAG: hypothetical protein WAM02_07260 [Candidatus Cybelea sp.]
MKLRINANPLLLASLVALSGCAASQLHDALPSGMPAAYYSWMVNGLTNQDLIYVSNIDNEVTVYTASNQKLVGVLTDFKQPMGECVDGTGNVYITDYAAEQVLEYAHGGGKPAKTFSDSPYSPYTCTIDPTTGDLAVADNGDSSQAGDIAIWPPGSSQPTRYTDLQILNFEAAAYDGSGNLLVSSGSSYGHATGFAWLPRGGTQLINVTVRGPKGGLTWTNLNGIMWDGQYFVLDAYDLYRVSLIHGQAYYVDEILLDYPEDSHPSGPLWIYKSGSQMQVIGGISGYGYGGEVGIWSYPGGGPLTTTFTHGVDQPFGVTVSPKQ